MNVNSFITKDYRKKDDFTVRKNKPNTNPIKPNFKRAQILLPPQVATGDLVKILYIVIGSLWRMDYNHHRPLAPLEICTKTTPVAAGELLLTGRVRKGVTAV